MFSNIQILCLGLATVIDTVLLLVLLEQRNRQFARVPLVVMVVGAWLWHGGMLALVLMLEFSGSLAHELQWFCQTMMVIGLLLMPCGMTHAALRLHRHGIEILDKGDSRHLFAYVPMLVLAPWVLWATPAAGGNVLEALRPYAVPYVLFVGVVKAATAAALLRYRQNVAEPHARRFFAQLAAVLIGMAIVQWSLFFVVAPLWPDAEEYLLLVCALTPLAPTLLLAYFVLRYNFLQLMLERTLVYGAIAAGVVMFHQIAFQGVSSFLPERYRLPLIMLEGVALTALILGYQPLRQRFAESLRYLLGHRVAEMRARLRLLATELTARAGRPPRELLTWFAEDLRAALAVDFVAGWMFHPSGDIHVRCGDADRISDEEVARLRGGMQEANALLCTPTTMTAPPLAKLLRSAGASLAVLKRHQNVSGLLLVGRQRGNLQLGEEVTNTVSLLLEQLAITADNSLLQMERLVAERRAVQNEKLSVLGLLASSIAHEVKNPLSAIKTIATVLAEDLGPESPHAEGVGLILGEVDRLSESTNRILDFARPKLNGGETTCVDKVVLGTLHVLQHLARQQEIVIDMSVEPGLPPVHGSETALREIFFNLVSNSLDAAGHGGRITVDCRRDNGCVVTEVRDNGPGIAPELRDRLFQPFSTSKPEGTGLGLYVVGRHVNELGGEISCASGPDGTSFVVKLRVT